MWSIPPKQDGAFVCAMENVLAVYKRPLDRHFPVVCMVDWRFTTEDARIKLKKLYPDTANDKIN